MRTLVKEELLRAVLEKRVALDQEAEIRRLHRERWKQRLPEMKELAKQTIRIARAPFRILCLSQVAPDDTEAHLLWGHYTDSHRGFVITFNEDDKWFAEHQPKLKEPKDCGAVIYSARRPAWRVHGNGVAEPQSEFVLTKSLHWAYEKEYRLIRFEGTTGVESTPVDALVAVPPSAIRAVTLGENAGHNLIQRVKAVAMRPAFEHLKIYQAKIDPDEYRLNVCALS